MKTLYPMDMEEFMLALGEDDLVERIKKCFNTDTPLPSALHNAAMQLYRQYLVVGGMPECVMQFNQTKNCCMNRYTRHYKMVRASGRPDAAECTSITNKSS